MKFLEENLSAMDRLSGIFGDLQQTNRFPWNGQLMSTCEAELQELMKQIDIMVQSKKMEWERELQAVESKLQIRDRECNMQRSNVEQKTREITQLRQQVENIERSHRDTVSQHERNLDKVKNDFGTLRRDYEKLQKKMAKHTKDVAKEKNKASNELQGTHVEMQRAQTRLEDYRQKSKDWDIEKRNLEQQIESLESQRRTLQEKCDLIEQQASGYQSQLDRRRQILDNTEYNLKTQITQLEGQVERAQDTINSQESQIDKLKLSLDETVAIQRRLFDEKDFVERELRDSKKHVISLEDEVSHLRLECQKQEDYLRIATDRIATDRIATDSNQNASRLPSDQPFIDLPNLQNQATKEAEENLFKTNEELRQTKLELKKHRKNERRLEDELARQKSHLKQAETDVDKLRQKFHEKMGTLKIAESKQTKELQSELSQFKTRLAAQKDSHESQISDLKQKILTLKSEQQERLIAANKLNDQFAHAQTQHRDESEKYDKRASEIQVANAQLEALRLENRHLRQTAMKQIQTSADVMEAESHLKDLQNAYTASLSRMESENNNLHHELEKIHSKLRLMESESMQKDVQTRTLTERSIQEVQETEHRRVKEMQSDYEKRLNSLQQKMERKVRDAQTQLDQIVRDKHGLENELKQRTNNMKRVFTENEVMSHFVEDVSEIISSPTKMDDPRARMVTPRLVGLNEGQTPTVTPFASAFHPISDRRTSTRVHFNDSELPNQSLFTNTPANEMSSSNQNFSDSANQRSGQASPNQISPNYGTGQSRTPHRGARPKTKTYSNERSSHKIRLSGNSHRRSTSPLVQNTTEIGHQAPGPSPNELVDYMSSPSLNEGQSPVQRRSPNGRITSPAQERCAERAPSRGSDRSRSPTVRISTLSTATSPSRVPPPDYAFLRISPDNQTNYDSQSTVDRAQAASGTDMVDLAPLVADTRREHERARSEQSGNVHDRTVGESELAALMDNLDDFSLSDMSDTEQERPDSRASLATRFQEEEEKRTRELEALLNSHIEVLKTETDKTIRKYAR